MSGVADKISKAVDTALEEERKEQLEGITKKIKENERPAKWFEYIEPKNRKVYSEGFNEGLRFASQMVEDYFDEHYF
jgi:hypothetical protein